MKYENITIKIDEELYNKLNRASREYDGYVTDAYYFITGANHPTENTFANLVDLAVQAYLDYGVLKDVVSNDWAIPAVKETYNLNGTDNRVSISWNINFNGTEKCDITDINVSPDSESTVYEGPCDDKWVESVALLNIKYIVLSEIIAKVSTTTALTNDVAKCLRELRDMRIDTDIELNKNKATFMQEFVNEKIEGHDPSKCTWHINPNDKTIFISENV